MTDIHRLTIQNLRYTGQKVFILSRPHLESDFLKFLEYRETSWRRDPAATDAELLVEIAGRICYMSFGANQSPKSNRDYIVHLIKSGHESVLEHANWSFVLCGVSRSFTHQLVRHRVGFSYSQLSQQYHDESEATFVIPENLKQHPAAVTAWRDAIKNAVKSYKTIINTLDFYFDAAKDQSERREYLRAVRSAARSVLPNSTETAIFVTANARAIRHFLSVRGTIRGDYEMRQVASSLLQAIQPDAPSIFFDFSIEYLNDDLPIVIHKANLETPRKSPLL